MKKVSFLQRLQAIIIDYAVIIVIIMPIAFLAYAFKLLEKETYQLIFLSFVFGTLFCKDLINGRSFGKYATKLQILTSDGQAPSSFRLIIRNITTFIWPVELIVCMFSPDRKLGDFLAGTKIVAYTSESKFHTGWIMIILSYLITIAALYILFYYSTVSFVPNGLSKVFFG